MKIDDTFLTQTNKEEETKVYRYLLDKIPQSLLIPNNFKSWCYFFMDLSLIFLCFLLGNYSWSTNNYLLGFVYIILQGTFFIGFFALGHDCGHETFSTKKWQNLLSGYIVHSFLLTPFYSWKMSHSRHHRFHNQIGADESHQAISITEMIAYSKKLQTSSLLTKIWIRFQLFMDFLGLVPITYLINNHPFLKTESFSHFNPNEKIFKNVKKQIFLSVSLVFLMIGFIACLALLTSFKYAAFIYFAPWIVYNFWLYFITYLHHMSGENYWYYSNDWSFVKGALQTIDHDHGKILGPIMNFIHHDIQRYHVIHHLNYRIPHYNLKKAHEAIHEDIKLVYKLRKNPLMQFIKIKYLHKYLLVSKQKPEVKAYKMISSKRILKD